MRSVDIKTIIMALILSLLGGCEVNNTLSTPQPAKSLGIIDQFDQVYHGLALDEESQTVTITAQDIVASLDAIIEKYKGVASIDAQRIQQLRADLAKEQQLTEPLAWVLKGAQAQMLVEAAPGQFDRAFLTKLDYLREHLKEYLPAPTELFNERSVERFTEFANKRQYLLDPKLIDIIREWTLWPRIFFRYCLFDGVPQPPDWGDARWQRKVDGAVTTVPADRLYILNDAAFTTEVWTYTHPVGGCIALPRKRGASTTLGVICQNKNTGKACFWDNKPHGGGRKFSNADMLASKKSIVNHWVNGNDRALIGGGKCTECHRGENAFLLHQDTLLSNNPVMPFDTDAAQWYSMVNNLGWSNPPKTNLPGNSGCVSCHEIGSTTDAEKAKYCSILKKAANREMPSIANPATWNPAQGSAEKTHIDIMKTNGCP